MSELEKFREVSPELARDISILKEKEAKADLLGGVLALPQRVIDHIKNPKDSSGQPAKAGRTLAALVNDLYESSRSKSRNADSERALRRMVNSLSVARDAIDSDQIGGIMLVPKNLVSDIQRAAFAGDTMHKAMSHVSIDFPSADVYRKNQQKGRETMIGLKDKDGRVIERVPLGNQLKVILDSEAARLVSAVSI
jgi:hypothetical protein